MTLLAELDRLADRARHPALSLERFADDYDEDETPLTAAQLLVARRRRAAVVFAANSVIDHCMWDLQRIDWGGEVGPPQDTIELQESFVWRFFPPRFRSRYTRQFFANVLVTAAKVGHDLARPDAGEPACSAEEIILNAVCRMADTVMEAAAVGRPWMDLTEMLLEDLDFQYLFERDTDGIEDDPAAQRDLGMWVPGVDDWFAAFNESRFPHPYVETEEAGPRAHDLLPLIRDDVLDAAIIDDPRPITSLDPASEAVALARAAADPTVEAWIADASAPESSFADLVDVAARSMCGWLTWEPHEGADAVRKQGVIIFRPHRHFPVGADQPWAEVSISRGFMYVPLSAVVAYTPDPEVRERRVQSTMLGDQWP